MKKIQCLAVPALVAAAAMSIVSCGSEEDPDRHIQREWVYEPEFMAIEGEDAFYYDYYDMKLAGDNIYYPVWERDGDGVKHCREFYRYSLADRELTQIPLQWQDGENNKYIQDFVPSEDGSIYLIVYGKNAASGTDGSNAEVRKLYRFDAQGNHMFSRDLTRLMEESESGHVSSMAIDAKGRLYLGSGTLVWLYDGEGNYQGSISVGNSDGWIAGLNCGRDGKVYAAYYDSTDSVISLDSMEYSLTELDFDGQTEGAVYDGFPSNDYVPGDGNNFLVSNDSFVYEYDLSAQNSILLFDWLECNINGIYARCLGVLEDGRLVAVYEDWPEEELGIALLTKTEAGLAAQKEMLVLAAMTADGTLQSSVAKFNRGSSQYHITIKEYYDSDISWADAVTNLHNDIISGNCPDLISLRELDLENLAGKGVFEDLNLYLGKSSVLKREDILGSILDAYTFDGILVGIPHSFYIQTVIGSAEKIGEKQGWTLEEMIAFADAWPDTELFDRASKSSIMNDLMMFNMDAFIDWETGECSFDSDRFKSLLKFVDRYPDEAEWSAESLAAPARIQNGEVLLAKEYATDRLDFIQVYKEMFMGDVVCIGYPATAGSSGHAITFASQVYAISSGSDAKEGAWEFIESVLTQDEGRIRSGFPSIKDRLEVLIRQTLYAGYVLDERGEPVLDENGEMIADADGFGSISFGGGSVIGSSNMGNSWSYTYRAATQEEIDAALAVLDAARLVSGIDNEILNIITEEAEAFFKGQKTVEEAADIIQNRASVYVSEHQ